MTDFACGYVIEFTDGGEPEFGLLHRGTLEECERVAENTHGVAYSGTRPVKEARVIIVSVNEDEEEEHDDSDSGRRTH